MIAETLETFTTTLRAGRFFESGSSVIATRSPGRLDVMGGIADYSGSLVFEYPIAEATFAAIQLIDEPVIGMHDFEPSRVLPQLIPCIAGGGYK